MDELNDGRRLPTDEMPKCPRCNGTGVDGGDQDWAYISYDGVPICPDCNGVGYMQPEDEEYRIRRGYEYFAKEN